MVLGFVLVLTLNQSHDSDRQSVHHSGLPSGENLLQEVSGGVSWKPPALRPSASTTVSKPRPEASGAAPSQQQNVAAMQEPGHPCPTRDSSNGRFLLWVSTPAWPKHSQSCSLGLFLYHLSFPHCSPRPFLLPHFLFPFIFTGYSLHKSYVSNSAFASQKTWNSTTGTRSGSRKLARRWGWRRGHSPQAGEEGPNPSGKWGTATHGHRWLFNY